MNVCECVQSALSGQSIYHQTFYHWCCVLKVRLLKNKVGHLLSNSCSWTMMSQRSCECVCLTPFRQTLVPWLQTVRFSLAPGSGQSGERPEHTLALWQSVSSSQIWPAGLNPQSWAQHRPWLGLMDEKIIARKWRWWTWSTHINKTKIHIREVRWMWCAATFKMMEVKN